MRYGHPVGAMFLVLLIAIAAAGCVEPTTVAPTSVAPTSVAQQALRQQALRRPAQRQPPGSPRRPPRPWPQLRQRRPRPAQLRRASLRTGQQVRGPFPQCCQ